MSKREIPMAFTYDSRSRPTPPTDATGFAAAGRLRDAIAEGTATNRESRDPLMEYRLARWRYAAGQSLVPEACADRRRANVRDLFAGTVGVPEISARDLSPEVIDAAIQHHGGLIVRGLLPRFEAEVLADGVDRAFDAVQAARAGTPLVQTLPWYAPLDPANRDLALARHMVERWDRAVWTADSPRALFDLLEVFERHGVIGCVENLFGERPVMSVEKGTLRRVPPEIGGDWHQDGRFLGAHVRALNVWLALSPCGTIAPGLEILPCRVNHIVGTGTHGAVADWTIGPEEVRRAAEGIATVVPEFDAGDAALFDHLFLHRTAGRPGQTRTRWAIESWFFAPSAMPRHRPIVV
jgi:hypothetical protein